MMQARLHEEEMYVVFVKYHAGPAHNSQTAILCVTDNLEVALNTARTAEKFGFNIAAGGDSGAFISAFNNNVAKTDNAPIFVRCWRCAGEIMECDWWEEIWYSSIHELLANQLKQNATRRRTQSRR